MKAVVLALCLAVLPAALPAQDDPLDAAIDATLAAFQNEGAEAAVAAMNRALRTARADGSMSKDWSFALAIQADLARNALGNPVLALALCDEGLRLIAGDPDYAVYAMMLTVSRAYALADLGRLAEAADGALSVLPLFRVEVGDVEADDLVATIAAWSDGRLTGFNDSFAGVARRALDSAAAAAQAGDHGRALTLAATAVVPPGSGLPEAEARALTAEAESAIARSLAALGRQRDAAGAWQRALAAMTSEPWTGAAPPAWIVDADWQDTGRTFALAALFGLADALGPAHPFTARALDEAGHLAQGTLENRAVLLRRAVLAAGTGDIDAAMTMIGESRVRAEADGDALNLALADFYAAMMAIRLAPDGATPDPGPLLAAAAGLFALSTDPAHGLDRAFILGDAARFLRLTPARAETLAYAREALHLRRAQATRATDTGFGQAQARAARRGAVETFLRAAHNAASAGLDPTAPATRCVDSTIPDYMGCLILDSPR